MSQENSLESSPAVLTATTEPPPFKKFESIPRLKRGIVITEKIDGTNAQIFIDDSGHIHTGSRNRWITPNDDNFGFAQWASEHQELLKALGPGHHYGEWYGPGIQRGYGHAEKRFALFNTGRWNAENPPPKCCEIVPVLHTGDFTTEAISNTLEQLRLKGSTASPGFMRPEGIVVYHTQARRLFKITIDNDDAHKGN